MSIGDTSWKKKGGVIGVDLRGTKGHLIKTKGIVIGSKWGFGKASGFATTDISSWYGSTLLANWLLRMVIQLT
jgi:hypothetical protein